LSTTNTLAYFAGVAIAKKKVLNCGFLCENRLKVEWNNLRGE
jgi:hypothetical protein